METLRVPPSLLASYAAALKAGRPVDIGKVNSIATSLGARIVCEEAFKWSSKHKIISYVCNDKSAVNACVNFADDHRVLVEPACGAALFAVYENSPVLSDYSKILLIVCGGAGVSLQKLNEWRKQFWL